jgi:hypothetical protein
MIKIAIFVRAASDFLRAADGSITIAAQSERAYRL